LTSVVLGILAALLWGGGDFLGGLSSRKIGAMFAVFCSEWVGVLFLAVAIPFASEPIPPLMDLVISAVAGAIGSACMILLYHALSNGKMSVAAPVSALLAAALPITVSMFTEGLPGWVQIAGFGFALASVWLISRQEGSENTFRLEQLAELRLPILAGLGFGTYFLLIHHASQAATFWPIVASRLGGGILLSFFVLVQRKALVVERNTWWLIVSNAALDVAGNVCFLLAGRWGRMDMAVALSGLYPGGTVILAWLFLKEHINRSQLFGILTALAAIALLTV
jgi:drug/metabolite transporter (DMT)-like permease